MSFQAEYWKSKDLERVNGRTSIRTCQMPQPSVQRRVVRLNLSEEAVKEYLESNIVMLKWMISEGYGDVRTIERRIKGDARAWLARPCS